MHSVFWICKYWVKLLQVVIDHYFWLRSSSHFWSGCNHFLGQDISSFWPCHLHSFGYGKIWGLNSFKRQNLNSKEIITPLPCKAPPTEFDDLIDNDEEEDTCQDSDDNNADDSGAVGVLDCDEPI